MAGGAPARAPAVGLASSCMAVGAGECVFAGNVVCLIFFSFCK